MNSLKKKIDPSRIKDFLLAASPVLVLAAIVLIAGYCFVDPAPPKKLVISAGDPSGRYFQSAEQYRDIIKGQGVDVEILPSKGVWENLKRLEDPKSGVMVGFVQDGLGTRQKFPGLTSLGSLYYEPVWIFYRGNKELKRLTDLQGKRIAMGPYGGETHTMAKKLLNAAGVTDKNSTWVETEDKERITAIDAGSVDVAFFVASANDEMIGTLMKDKRLRLMSLDQAEAITRQFPYLHHLTLPHGTFDLQRNFPPQDVELVSPTATLVVNKSIHPALVYLLLKAMTKVHHEPGIFAKKWEFPIDKDYTFTVNDGAKEYFKSGAPFWLRYLPFWLATLMERFIFIILPTGAVLLPILRMIPRFLNWRVRSRITQRYGELKMLEDQIDPKALTGQIDDYMQRLDTIEDRVHQMNFPADVIDDIYMLREHIHFVRERLNRMSQRAEVFTKTAH